MKTLKISICLSLIFFTSFSQNDSDSVTMKSPFQVTFVTPIGTNGVQSYRISNEFSLNILVGINGGVDGFELGGMINIIKKDVSGVQISGFGNLVNGDVDGAQIAGFTNINGGYTDGFQIAGFANLVKENSNAFQLAGFGNICATSQMGQISGFGNISEDVTGIQASGFGNLSGNVDGVQLGGFTNIGKNIDGFQGAGFFNLAKKVEGVQIAGFLNICDSIDGIPIAPISIVKTNGYLKAEFWTNEMFYLNTSFKIGVRKFYTIYSLGYKPGSGNYDWNFGYGAGTSVNLGDNVSFDPQIGVSHFFRHLQNDYNQLNQFKLIFNYQLAENLGIFAGPTFNLLITEYTEDASEIAPSWSFIVTKRNKSIRSWFGFNFGMRFL